MKKYFFLFAVGLLACANSRQQGHEFLESDPFVTWATPFDPSTKYFTETQIGDPIWYGPASWTVLRSDSIVVLQEFKVTATITFPSMTLQQAAELETKLKKLLPEAQEINLDVNKNIIVPAQEHFYDVTPDLSIPHYFLNNDGHNILRADSSSTIIWQNFDN